MFIICMFFTLITPTIWFVGTFGPQKHNKRVQLHICHILLVKLSHTKIYFIFNVLKIRIADIHH